MLAKFEGIIAIFGSENLEFSSKICNSNFEK